MKYISGVDGLRAIAVMSVVLFHAGFQTFSGGFIIDMGNSFGNIIELTSRQKNSSMKKAGALI